MHGGQQPVGGAHIYVLAVGAGGYGTASSSLLLPGLATADDGTGKYYVTADANGNFSVTGDYVCTSGSQVYLYAAGGSPGGGAANPAIGLMAGLGQCPTTGTLALQVPFVVVNEVSTVVTAYALAGFATDPLHIASGATALGQTAVKNAMASVANIVSVPQGIAFANSPSGAVANPVQNINTLADILAACINSGGGTSSACTVLLGNAASLGATNGIVPTDTATAAINLAHYPFGNIATLYNLQTASAPFQPTLTTAPADFTLALYYNKTPAYLYNQANNPGGTITDNYLNSESIAFDADGSAWVLSAGTSNSNYAHLSPSGQVLVSVTSLPTVSDVTTEIGIDNSGNVWGQRKRRSSKFRALERS